MIVLAIDTAGTACNVALYDSARGAPLGNAGADIGRGHAERLMGFIDEALERSGLEMNAIDRVAVTIGPGSFTGIRVGVAAARGLGLALGIPVVGVSVLQAQAFSVLADNPGQSVLIVTDAKREEVYVQSFDAAGQPLTEAEALDIATARTTFGQFAGTISGSGAALLREDRDIRPGETHPETADIVVVARLGAAHDPSVALPKPLYLRGPDVRSQAGFAVARA
ncbi:tRNA threonylcarbamoyladenosine biosynthesis protein TsaB [Rhizobium sp. Leaf384]|uniref:tRNA (adenosine(37)-N6)-threonylcarbamoyltransferase complex dimerization subunit type 1 TsaB n=1 Tax=unclassified Rhizobium TaxID=2613769 RepID=UPI0007145BC8|nr:MULTISPECIES: tRNA (adenosine(37)-N6)-threonylcarbamoyltransferase complex dimerization subunit type 1 TsaB [unclassified Rhizobium]KQS81141.1 tRNA threonylcarbamoyladenosine biosynthesis protein TsaB [Rhizobium sp. Leaf384]KQS87049.1 tRNA threonylcarbamoyladenosine biosynthesis protein TsaB [Rhizobium sp. Leaf383]